MEQVNVLLITQARMGSTRLPGKVLMKIDNLELLYIHLHRLRKVKLVDKIILATTTNKEDDILEDFCKNFNVFCSRGSVNDVLDRFYVTSKPFKPKWVVRVTSDCPLIDPEIVDSVISKAIEADVDYCSNVLLETFPDGQDIEVFKFSALEYAWGNAVLLSDREHVTPFIRNNSDFKNASLFKAINIESPTDYSSFRMTVDEYADFELIEILVKAIGIDQSWLEYVKTILEFRLENLNSNIPRNEGYFKSIKNDSNGNGARAI